jgi:ABC-type glycerol-3-phosphate transport system substrate-binding protein
MDVVWTPYVYYNKDIFNKVGIQPPTTWDELYAIAGKLRGAGIQPLTLVYGMSVQSHLMDAMEIRSWSDAQYNVMPIKWRKDAPADAAKYKWTDPDSVKIFEMIKAMADKKVFIDGFTGLTDYDGSRALFLQGKAAMFQNGSWDGGKAGLPRDAKFDIGYFYYPPIRQDQTAKVGSWLANGLIIPKKGKNLDEAHNMFAWTFRVPQVLTYTTAAGIPAPRLDIPTKLFSQILTPLQITFLEETVKYNSPALLEGASAQPYYDATTKSIDLMLTGGYAPDKAAAWLDQKLEEVRAAQK